MEVHDGEMEVTFPNGSEEIYRPLNFHFHAPSDHTLHGKHFDLEMHIVHVKKSNKQLGAVLSILFDSRAAADYPNPFITSLSPELMNLEGYFVVLD